MYTLFNVTLRSGEQMFPGVHHGSSIIAGTTKRITMSWITFHAAASGNVEPLNPLSKSEDGVVTLMDNEFLKNSLTGGMSRTLRRTNNFGWHCSQIRIDPRKKNNKEWE